MSYAGNRSTLALALCLLCFALAGHAGAQPEFDPLATNTQFYGSPIPPEVDSQVIFGTVTNPALPADFFGPGSDPFAGNIWLQGAPLDEWAFGDASTLLHRGDHPVLPWDPVGTVNVVPIEIVDLDIRSFPGEMGVTYDGGSSVEYWGVELRPSAMPVPPGNLVATKTHVNGGVFSAEFFLQPAFLFTRLDDGMTLTLDTGLEGWPPWILSLEDAPWVHFVDPDLDIVAPSDEFFVPGVRELFPGDPTSQCPEAMLPVEPHDSLIHALFPAAEMFAPDPYVVVPGCQPGGSQIVFGVPENPPLPADFFGPGSDPFEGTVCLQGEPLGPTEWGSFNNANTLIMRPSHPFDRCDMPHPDPRGVDYTIVALNLVSIDPITVSYLGGIYQEMWDVHVGLAWQDPMQGGGMNAHKTHANGGTFWAQFLVWPQYTFTRVGDGTQVVLDHLAMGYEPLILTADDVPWVHIVEPWLDVMAPSDRHFVPCVWEEVPGDPLTQIPVPMPLEDVTSPQRLTLMPAPGYLVAVDDPPAPLRTIRAAPNPFNPGTEFRFDLARGGPVRLRIYDVQGTLVRTLIDGELPRGDHALPWRGTDDRGRRVPSGVYFGVLQADGEVRTTKVAIVK